MKSSENNEDTLMFKSRTEKLLFQLQVLMGSDFWIHENDLEIRAKICSSWAIFLGK